MQELEGKIAAINKRVTKIDYDGQVCYVKKRAQCRRNGYHRLQSIVFCLTRNTFFAPTLLGKDGNMALHEAEKLKRVKALGINVPAVLRLTEDYFIMEDCGERLDGAINETDDDYQEYLGSAIQLLARLHKNGECHGGSQIRNFTIKDGQIYMIDFEEYIRSEHFSGIAFRDVVLFLLSVALIKRHKFSLMKLVHEYELESGIPIEARLRRFFGILSFFNFLRKKPFNNFVGRDVIGTLNALDELKNYKNKSNKAL